MVQDLKKLSRLLTHSKKKDWIRISIDAAGKKSPRLTLAQNPGHVERDLRKGKKGEKRNAAVSLGYSFVIVWEAWRSTGEASSQYG